MSQWPVKSNDWITTTKKAIRERKSLP